VVLGWDFFIYHLHPPPYHSMLPRYEELQQWDEALSRYNEKLDQNLPDKSSYVLGKLRFVSSQCLQCRLTPQITIKWGNIRIYV
jgi:hypothetical protein